VTWHGLLTVITIALAVTFVSEHQGGPQLLYALFFGMAFNIAANGEKVKAGIECASASRCSAVFSAARRPRGCSSVARPPSAAPRR
jgi:hypothetical protein